MQVNKEELERLLFVGITKDENLIALLGNKFRPQLFTQTILQEVSNFYFKFYQRFGRLPNEGETQLFYNHEKFKEYFNTVKVILASSKYDEIDKDLLYSEFETYVKQRSAYLVINDVVTNISSKPIEAEKLVSQFEDITNISLCDLHVFDAQKDVEAYFEDVSNSAKRLPTGFKEIDKNINGGILADGKFIGVIFAETNMGKSIMLTNLATNVVRQGKNVLIISLELSEVLYATRAYADLYDLPVSEINFRRDELEANIQRHPEYGKLYIKEFPPASMTVDQIGGFIENLINRGYHFDLVCVDYLTLLTTVNKAENSNEVGKEITRKLRALTYKFPFPIMTAAQLNRGGFDSVPSNKNAAESIAIPQEADFAIGLYQQSEDKEQNIMRVKCTKSRLGSNDWTVTLHYNRMNLRFEDMNAASEDNLILSDNAVMSSVDDVLDVMDDNCPF